MLTNEFMAHYLLMFAFFMVISLVIGCYINLICELVKFIIKKVKKHKEKKSVQETQE